ncbi:MAG TPA: pyrroloquinoline quinone biosynthesis peptide chaperone PqqD [Polyangiaceae bacterium]|nr:pyrroloquinoline quinone biosynthesis peptide chaperone PqqD [Polyangiaceae bacterium]
MDYDARPRLRHARLRRRGDAMLLLAPERGFSLGGAAPAILELVDGSRTVEQIVDALARDHAAPRETISRDVHALLEALARRGLIRIA